MMKRSRLYVLFFFILFLTVPLFAEEAKEAAEEMTAVEEVVTPTETTKEGVITGKVVSLDAVSGTISVKTALGLENTFSVIDEETILWEGIEDIKLADIDKGETAEVGYYTDEGGKLIASWVDVLVEEEAAPLEKEKTTESEPKTSPRGE
ncbi:hypothetical protein ACFL28_03610 [Candidatus Omnitrophota bacterium]